VRRHGQRAAEELLLLEVVALAFLLEYATTKLRSVGKEASGGAGHGGSIAVRDVEYLLPAQRLRAQHVQPRGKGAGHRTADLDGVCHRRRSFITSCRKRRRRRLTHERRWNGEEAKNGASVGGRDIWMDT
jgi:hypothetical protein